MSAIMKSANLEDFLSAHILDKNSTEPVTHTTFGKYNAKYHIPLTKQSDFLALYYKHIIKTGKTHNIIERQIIEKNAGPGPLLTDIDFRFAEEHFPRQYTEDHVYQYIKLNLSKIEKCFEMDEDVQFPIFVMEKPNPRVEQKPTGNIVKDGIHIIIGLNFPRVYHQYIRDQVVQELDTIWSDLPITNTKGWEDVIDTSISNGSNGWLMLNSKKKDDPAHYELKAVLDVSYDTDESHWTIVRNTEQIDQYIAKNHKLLSARYVERPTLLPKMEMASVIQSYEEGKSKPVQQVVQNTRTYISEEIDELGWRIPMNIVRSIKNKDELEACIERFLDAVAVDMRLRDMRDAYEYAMILPEDYYGNGSYDKWVRVGFALRNMTTYMLIVWVAFSARASTFSYSSIPDMCDKWAKLNVHEQGGVTKQSLMYWAKNDAAEAYEKIRETSLDYYVDATIDSMTLENMSNKKNCRGGTDTDIAEVLFQMKKDEYTASAYKNNTWYRFKGHRWMVNDSAVDLRKVISSELRDLYRHKANQIWDKARSIPEGAEDRAEERNILKIKADKVLELALSLGNTKIKDNIMKEAREKFYNEEFIQRLDTNKYLLCFNNGVIDFKTKTFRPGYSDDYISKSTKIDYIKLNPSIHQTTMDEIEDYMHKLFPEKELCEYMWDHLSSVLIGDTALNQCLHYYTGIGQNGKSILVKLMQMILGEYAVELDVKFFTQERSKMGGTSSELYATIGARYAVTAEPSEGEKLNEGPMKQITSGTDKMSCRPLYGQQIEFMPQVHCVIMANSFLTVKSTDWGTWRRIRPVPFKSLFTDKPKENDPDKPYQFKKVDSFDEKFKAWAPIFMSMLVERAYKTKGIVKECSIVANARDKYRIDQDVVAEYISHKMVACEQGTVGKSELTANFNSWYQQAYQQKGQNKIKELFAYMDKTYIGNKNVKGAITGWKGVCIEYNEQEYKNEVPDDDDTTISEKSHL